MKSIIFLNFMDFKNFLIFTNGFMILADQTLEPIAKPID